MVESGNAARRYLNPWALHLQKLELELKCPICLKLFDQPMLLPCDHIFCRSCLDLTLTELECPICYLVSLNSAIRPSSHTGNLVSLYRNMGRTFYTIQQSSNSEIRLMAAAVSRGSSVDLPERLCGSTNLDSKDRSCNEKCNNHNNSPMRTDELAAETNRVLQPAPDSPPSLGGPSGDDDSSDQGSEHCLKTCLPVDSLKEKCDTTLLDKNKCLQEHECSRDVKRQKTLLCDFTGTGIKSSGHQEVDSRSSKSIEGTPISKHSLNADHSIESKFKCAFCQSSRILKRTGPMLHYSADGAPVEGDTANRPNIIHVHEICINWAPQIYFKDDIVQNLKGELARGAKLKCSQCGRKGAALGCYEKSCKKTFHVTCAMEISECRWSLEDFLMLCRNHASIKFPHEKSHNVKENAVEDFGPLKTSKDSSNFWVTSDAGAKEWVFCGSALTYEEKSLMMKLSTKHGIRVTKYWQPDVTHVIASIDANGACCRTLKVLMGVLHGIWILKIDWIKACLDAHRPVDEELYEVSIDNHGCVDGPKTGRMRALTNGTRIFVGLQFYFSGDFIPGFKRDLNNLLIAAGGTIISSEQELAATTCKRQQTVIVYNLDPLTEDKPSYPGSVVQQRCEEAINLANIIEGKVVAHTWLLESIAACKLQPWVI